MPRISVVMPLYNAEPFLGSAIESILAQTFGNFEFIIVDDGSTDASAVVVRRYAKSEARIRFMQQENAGVTAALQMGCRASTGELIARMDADDVAMPTRFVDQLGALEGDPTLAAVGSFYERIDADGDLISVAEWPTNHEEIDQALLQGRGGLPHPTAMIRRQTLEQVGGYRSQYPVAQDKDLWLRLTEVGRLANLPVPLLQYREHTGAVSTTKQREQQRCVDEAIADAHRRRGLPPPTPRRPSTVASTPSRRRDWVRSAVRAGNLATAWKHSQMMLREQPWSARNWWITSRLVVQRQFRN